MSSSPTDPWRLADDEISVRLARLDDWRPAIAELVALLDAGERARAGRFLVDDARIAYIVAHGLLRRWLAGLSGLAPEAFTFAAGAGGKPRLAGHPRVCFSLSHTTGLVAAAVALDRAVGIDVEVVRDGEPSAGLLDLALTEAERRGLRSLPPTVRRDRFFRSWTRKEAFLKATGEGLARGPKAVDVAPGLDTGEHPLVLCAGGAGGETYGVVDLAVPAGFCGAVAWRWSGALAPRLDVLSDGPGPSCRP